MKLPDKAEKPAPSLEEKARASRSLPTGMNADGHDATQPVIFSYSSDSHPPIKRLLIKIIEAASGQRRMKKLYEREIEAPVFAGGNFFDLAIQALKLDIHYSKAQLDRIPTEGPVVFVANHPYGVLDGVTLTWLARLTRPDVKVLAHRALCQVPSAQPNLLPIDFENTKEAQAITLNSRVRAQKHLRNGGAIGIFPGGGVATSLRPLKGPAVDPPWHPFTAKMIMGSKATVVPVYFSGQNSRLFQAASHISYTLRQSLMFRETARRQGKRLDIAVGEPIDYETLRAFPDRQSMVTELRRQTFGLAKTIPGLPESAADPEPEFHFPKSWS